MINMFEDDKVFVAPDVDVNKYLNEGNEEGLEEKIHDKGGNNQIYKSEDFKEGFLDLLLEDKKKIQQLVDEWSKIEYDPKLDKFLLDLKKNFLNKKKNPSSKLVIFSESKETIDYLEDKLTEAGVKKILAISAANRKEKQKTIQLNFDANQDKKDWKNEFDIVLTT